MGAWGRAVRAHLSLFPRTGLSQQGQMWRESAARFSIRLQANEAGAGERTFFTVYLLSKEVRFPILVLI